jgi:transcriptional regulator with XRE-family HTH domain
VKDSLNVTKESRDDWRGVASRMGVKAPTIEKIARNYKENPTHKLFQELSSKKTTELLQVLYQMDLHDVLNIFYDKVCVTKPGSLPLCKIFQHLSNTYCFLIY